MNRHLGSRVQRWNERGQTLVLIPLLLAVLLGICALAIDMGNIYVCYQQLQSSTQAAALAGAQAMSITGSSPSNLTPKNAALKYSGSLALGANYNIHPNLNITTVTPSLTCVDPTTYPGLNLPPCTVYDPADGSVNLIRVKEAATVPTYFAKIFGVKTVPIAATAVASARGGGSPPYNIMLVLDTTASMGSGNDTNCIAGVPGGRYTPEQCAQYGVQTLLKQLSPCPSSYTTCPAGLVNAVDQVGLMVFPGLTPTQTATLTTTAVASTANAEYDCNTSTNPSITHYNNNPLYLILGFQNDYRNPAATTLNQGSNLFKTVGAGVGSGRTACGAQTPGGEGTFYAGVIVAAQDYLTANARQGAKNVMIFLSDGDATASASQMGGTTKQVGASASLGGMRNGLFQPTAECTQAVNAANYAKAAGTLIYSISYGSANTGCNTGGETYTSPCATMQAIASTPTQQFFYSVPRSAAGQGTVCPNAANITQLSQVFIDIGSKLKTSRLVPNVVFPLP